MTIKLKALETYGLANMDQLGITLVNRNNILYNK